MKIPNVEICLRINRAGVESTQETCTWLSKQYKTNVMEGSIVIVANLQGSLWGGNTASYFVFKALQMHCYLWNFSHKGKQKAFLSLFVALWFGIALINKVNS